MLAPADAVSCGFLIAATFGRSSMTSDGENRIRPLRAGQDRNPGQGMGRRPQRAGVRQRVDASQPSVAGQFIARVVDLAMMAEADALNDPPRKQQQAGVPAEGQGESENEHRRRPQIGNYFGNRWYVYDDVNG